LYSVVSKQKSVEAFEQRKIAQGDDGVVREIYSIVLVLWAILTLKHQNPGQRTHTRVTPRFSMAGIL
jgi:hypothetical protein